MIPPRTVPARPGVALITTLGMTMLLGLLIAGAVAANTLAHRATAAQLDQAPLVAALDVAAAQALAAADSLHLAELEPGSSSAFDIVVSSSAHTRVSATVTAIGLGILWIALDARSLADTTHRRRAGLIARFPLAGVIPPAPVISQDSATISTDTSVGVDTSCGSSSVTSHRSSDSTTVYDAEWQRQLLASATGVWRVGRDTTVGAVSYEGILIADGDLTIDGSAELRGLVIAHGRLQVRGGARVTGALVSQYAGVEISASQIRYSPCLVGRVLRRAASARTVHGRSWAELF